MAPRSPARRKFTQDLARSAAASGPERSGEGQGRPRTQADDEVGQHDRPEAPGPLAQGGEDQAEAQGPEYPLCQRFSSAGGIQVTLPVEAPLSWCEFRDPADRMVW